MSARHRPRNNHNQDADEERRLWNQIKADAKKIDGMVARSSAIGTEIVEVEEQQAALVGELTALAILAIPRITFPVTCSILYMQV